MRSDKITLIKSLKPSILAKQYQIINGEPRKQAVANVTEGWAKGVDVSTTQEMVRYLTYVTEQRDIAIVAGDFSNAPANGDKFHLVPEYRLAEILGTKERDGLAGVHEVSSPQTGEVELYAARIKESVGDSAWILLDGDSPNEMPDAWASLDIAGRLAMWERLLPGISTCERIELRSSSSRVVPPNGSPGAASHAWIRVSNPEKIAILRAYMQVETVNHGLAFACPRFSRDDGHVIGHEHRTMFDLSVWVTGRLVFCAKPEISQDMWDSGWHVVDADVRVFNAGSGPLDISSIDLPGAPLLNNYQAKTGKKLEYTLTSTGSLSTHDYGSLTMDTPIEREGVTKALKDWVEDSSMSPGDKLRCEAPFRASQSQAAFIGMDSSGKPFVYDIGNLTKYHTPMFSSTTLAKSATGEVQHYEIGQSPNNNTISTVDAFDFDESQIPTRPWMIPGVMLRGYTHILVAPGGSGKSLFTLQLAISLATGEQWGGWVPRKRHKCLIINVEDDLNEQRRRLAAARRVMNPDMALLKGMIHLADDAQSIVVAKVNPQTKGVIATPLVDQLRAYIIENQIDTLIVDPFTETFEGDENSNSEIKWAMKVWRDEIARPCNCAVYLVHHTTKYANGGAGDANIIRGAGAIVNSVRIAATLMPMTSEEAQTLGIDPDSRNRYVRYDDAKANQSLVSGKGHWFEKVSIELNNGGGLGFSDEVGALVPWSPPDAFDGISTHSLKIAAERIHRGLEDDDGQPTGEKYTLRRGGQSDRRWAGKVLMECFGIEAQRAITILKTWQRNELLDEVPYDDPVQRKSRNGVVVDMSKVMQIGTAG